MGETIREWTEKGKAFLAPLCGGRDIYPALLLVAVGSVSFGLGRLSVAEPFSTGVPTLVGSGQVDTPSLAPAVPATSSAKTPAAKAGAAGVVAQAGEGKYVASKNSTKYHLPWCSGAARIAERNKIWFSSKEEAEAAGYTPAANCKGI